MKIGFLSLGCPKNLVDGEVMLGLAEQAGHEITADAADADVLVVNTCAFIDAAKQESIDAILQMAELKRAGRCRRLVVTGCLAERYRDELRAEMPEIDAVLGTGEVPDIVRALGNGAERADSGRPKPAATEPLGGRRGARDVLQEPAESPAPGTRTSGLQAAGLPTYLYDADTPRHLATPGHFAYVKVAEGCDYTCSFCIIPTLRGHYRSRPADSIVREARALAERGVKELILISQDTTFYGVDRGERGALAALLRELNGLDGLTWIRLLYLYPTTIRDEVLDAMAECEKVCRYIDLPLQHASDRVLKRMGRPGTRAGYERLLARARARVPGVALRTTFIVGYPGETDEDVAELEAFVARGGVRPRGGVHLLPRGGHAGVRARRRRAGPGEAGPAQPGDAPAAAAGGPAPAGPDRRDRDGPGGRAVGRARPGRRRPARGPGARDRSGGVSNRL